MASKEADVLVGRRYLAKGYIDQALGLFTRNADVVTADDWALLRDRLLERGRLQDVVRVCELGRVALPREELLRRGDKALVTKDVDRAIALYELADADRPRWEKLVDALVGLPDRKRQAVAIADRHLVETGPASPHATQIKAVK